MSATISAAESGAPRIWINAQGKEPPAWVVENMTTGDIASDGTFNIETVKGTARALRGHAVVEVDGHIFCCPAREASGVIADARRNPPKVQPVAPKAAPTAKVEATAPVPAAQPEQAITTKPKQRPMVALGTPPVIQWIAPDQLEVDDTYQRSIEGGASQSLIRKIGLEWDWRLCIPLLVSRRGGRMFVIDGQHRLEGARLRTDIPHLPCAVFDFGGPEEEAELFVQANRVRRPMQRLDEFHAAIAAGDDKAIAINEMVTEAGLVVGRNIAWQMIKSGEVVFVGAIQRMTRIHGRELAMTSLKLIAQAFDGQPFPTAGAMFEAIVLFLSDRTKKAEPVSMDLLGSVLAGSTFKEWKAKVEGATNGYERNAMMQSAIAAAYGEAEGAE